MLVKVKDGTGAGRKMHVREVPRASWRCAAGHENKGCYATCMTGGCRERRP